MANGKQPAVRLRPDGEGVQFTPFGMAQLGHAEFEEGMPIAGASPKTLLRELGEAGAETIIQTQQIGGLETHTVRARPSHAEVGVAKALRDGQMPDPQKWRPGEVVKAAKARIKELRAFLREAKKAEKELKELERLVDAAKKPLAAVRDLRRTAG